MATKRGEKSKYELGTLPHTNQKKEDNYIERLVLPTDSLQGIALLYNTSISELKKINHFHTDADLHARRIIKVPARGILVDLTEAAAVPLPDRGHDEGVDTSDEESTNGQVYLENVDTALQEIREKAKTVAENSPILQGPKSTDSSLSRKELLDMKRKKEEIAWWKIAFPCIGVLLVLPFLYYLYLEHLEYIHHRNITHSISSNSTIPHSHTH